MLRWFLLAMFGLACEARHPSTPTKLEIGTVTVIVDGRVEMALAADGSVQVRGGDKQDMRLTANGELVSDGTVIAKIADDGSLSVLQESIEKRDGKVVQHDRTWTILGILASDGSISSPDGSKMTIDRTGKVTGLPFNFDITITGASTYRRAGVVLLLGWIGHSRSVQEH